MEGLSEEALKALQETLGLTEQELEDLARAVKELKSLENALGTVQLAKSLNSMDKLDGEACKGLGALKEYEELYKRILAAAGTQEQGPGMRGSGVGEGGKAPESPTDTASKSELSRSALTAGKMLMEWKVRGLSQPGESKEDFSHLLKDVRQGVSEAILQEQVPQNYHETIKRYFGSIGEEVGKSSGK